MAELMEYKCPCCGARLTFSSALQRMKCEYCDSEFDVETLKAYDDALKRTQNREPQVEAPTGTEWSYDEQRGLRIYSCRSCGGEVLGDETLAASACPFCGNPVIMTSQFVGDLRPDLVIPFKLDKEAAKQAFHKHLQGKRLLPKVFKSQHHIDEIKGVYVPFWLFDTGVDGTVHFRATQTRVWADARYNYTETKHFSVIRGGGMRFMNIPVDGSQKMDDAMMDSLEPFDMRDAVDFQTAYLAGYFADRYDVSAEASTPRVNQRVRASAEQLLRDTVQGYATVTTESSDLVATGGTSRYALLPVWLLNTTWNGKQYRFAMNGQTGKFVGDLPIDKGIRARWGILTGLGAMLLVYALLTACSL